MIALTHPVTGHQIQVDDESADFWKAAEAGTVIYAGYELEG